ncbi:MAG: hypothetical protein ABSG91_08550 [Syntrophobacteraceae bacterium]|jgi:signal transduction histidine kinase
MFFKEKHLKRMLLLVLVAPACLSAWSAFAVGALIKQILTNLILNASEAIGDREGIITAAIRVMARNGDPVFEVFPGRLGAECKRLHLHFGC